MQQLWPTEQELPHFKTDMLDFEQKCWSVGMKILSCFAYKLGFAEDFLYRHMILRSQVIKVPYACCTIMRSILRLKKN